MSNEIQFLLYNLPEDDGKVQVVIKDDTIWCTQKAMSQLFGIDKSGISRHINNILEEGELQRDTTVAKIATVVNRGIRGEVEEEIDFYNLDMIIAVGYRGILVEDDKIPPVDHQGAQRVYPQGFRT